MLFQYFVSNETRLFRMPECSTRTCYGGVIGRAARREMFGRAVAAASPKNVASTQQRSQSDAATKPLREIQAAGKFATFVVTSASPGCGRVHVHSQRSARARQTFECAVRVKGGSRICHWPDDHVARGPQGLGFRGFAFQSWVAFSNDRSGVSSK